ncbi:MAG: class I SAM-dependent methyltransferase, partial [Clostridium sp.]
LKDDDFMGFYEEIAKYYNLIFPTSQGTVNFIKKKAGEGLKEILDAACGTGGYSFALEKEGFNLTAFDLDKKMIEELKEKAQKCGSSIKAMEGNILEVKDKFKENNYDMVFCIGNSLVHLDNAKEIEKFFEGTKSILKEDGTLLFQVINYDRIISKGIKSLPTIYNEAADLTFERLYRYEESEHKVYFKTILTVEKEKFENEVSLYALQYDEAIKLLESAGFNNIEAYGDFKGSRFDKENSYAMIISGKVK